ncbi:MAG TPA: AraC family transcriptional regulator, partial [Acidimicrobiia bacterium]
STFPKTHMPADLSIYVAIRDLARSAARSSVNALAVEEFTVNTVSRLLQWPQPAVSRRHEILAADAEEYLAAHFRDDADLHTIGRQVGASPHHLSRVFRHVTGSTMSGRRTQLRLRHALHLLQDGAADISAVAVAAGFYDHSHLVKTTRAHLGLTPGQIRGLAGKNGQSKSPGQRPMPS